MAATFISYRRDDAAGYAGRLRESLDRRLGAYEIFRDVDTLKPGQDFVEAIQSRLASCRVMLVVIGREWLDARLPNGVRRLDDPVDFVRLEVAVGLSTPGVVVMPVLVEGASMPGSEALPTDLRALARRHAISLRDETWDEDVDRLVAAIRDVVSPGSGPSPDRPGRAGVFPWRWLAAIAAVVLIAAAFAFLRTPRPAGTDDAPASDASGAGNDLPVRTAVSPYAADVPRIAEVAFEQRIFSLVSAAIVPRGGSTELRLRLRLMNYERVDANFWNASFRLTVNGHELAPSGDLNDIVPGHSLRYGIVTFDVPASATAATLHIIDRDRRGDIPLDLRPTGRPPADEAAEVPDSLAQAIVRPLTTEPDVLFTTDTFEVTLRRATTRRFANTLRLSVALRIVNRGRVPAFSGDVVVRAAAGGDLLAPLEPLSDAVEAGTSISPTATFDLPTEARQVELRLANGGRSASRTFELP
ncbi:MAG: toll/interleukin-1 receptor domain-containing protein [Vicinamibacterales bacterium]